MSDPATIKKAFERNARAASLRPSIAQNTTGMKITLRDGTTCDIEGSGWKLTADVGKAAGGNNAGPGPGVFERAALGSCLAIGYATWAAKLGIPLDHLEVEVETDFDARGMLDVENRPPGFDAIRYRVIVHSSAPEEEIRRMIDKADAHSPVRDDFARPIPISREVHIKGSSG